MSKQRRPCTPEEMVEIPKKKGIIVTIEQAKAILFSYETFSEIDNRTNI